MSITYQLYLAEKRRPAEVVTNLGPGLGVESPTPSGGKVEKLDVEGLQVSALEPGRFTKSFMSDEYGLKPKTQVTVRFDTDHLDVAQDRAVDLLTLLVGQSKGDVVFLREDESVAYQRKDGQVEVGESDPLWSSSRRRSKLDRTKRRRNIRVE